MATEERDLTQEPVTVPPVAPGVVVAKDTRDIVTAVLDGLAALVTQQPGVVGGRPIVTVPEAAGFDATLVMPSEEPLDGFLAPGDGRLTPPAPGGSGGKRETTDEDWARAVRVATDAGFTGDALVTAVAVAATESVGFSDFEGDTHLMNETWGPSLSPWQIRSERGQTGTGGARDADALASDPWRKGAQSAWEISNGGKNWNPWTVFRTGSYRGNLPRARQAVEQFGARRAAEREGLETLRTGGR